VKQNLQGNSVQVIQAEPTNVEQIAYLFDEYRQFYGKTSNLTLACKFLQERLTKHESVIFIAASLEKDGFTNFLGFTQLYPLFSSLSATQIWLLNDLYVLPQARRQGIAKKLIQRVRQFAIETGSTGITLETASNNLVAQALYESFGFQKDETFYHYFLSLN
jgi:ribosomal protein S18 acetylase RimI-like enzyme